ncbi:MAG: hypothetical protein DMG32_11680 [Acidobacteria bacterium]|nr:MAG: hypothetical protein DMG32_11680 [Acidobacteriota bacterium]
MGALAAQPSRRYGNAVRVLLRRSAAGENLEVNISLSQKPDLSKYDLRGFTAENYCPSRKALSENLCYAHLAVPLAGFQL